MAQTARISRSQWGRWATYTAAPRYRAALAACLLIVIGLLTFRPWVFPGQSTLDMQVLVMLDEDRRALGRGRHVPEAEVDGMLQAVGAHRSGDIGVVQACRVTTVQGRKTAVMVVPGDMGPVSVALISGEQVGLREERHSAGFRGLVIPAARGAIAIATVGAPGEALDRVADRLRRSVS